MRGKEIQVLQSNKIHIYFLFSDVVTEIVYESMEGQQQDRFSGQGRREKDTYCWLDPDRACNALFFSRAAFDV